MGDVVGRVRNVDEAPGFVRMLGGVLTMVDLPIFAADHPIVGRDRVGASAAGPRVAASAGPSCLGAGAGAQGAGGELRAEAAEVLAGLRRLLSFVVPAP